MEEGLLALCRPFLEDPVAVQAQLCRRIERHIKELFVFVSHPQTPSDNNAAERSLRHLVVSRKISGGTRSGPGSDSKMTLASLFGTWRAKGLNPFLETRRLLISPHLLCHVFRSLRWTNAGQIPTNLRQTSVSITT